MSSTRLHINRWQGGLCALLVLLLTSLSLCTYSGSIESGDSLRLFDSASSLVHYGDLGRDESFWFSPPVTISATDAVPLAAAEDGTEPSIALAAVLYRLGLALPEIGLVHLVWLQNIFVTALTGGVFYLLALVWGFRTRTAFVGAALLGSLTILLPYSKTLFRDPVASLGLLLVALCVTQIHHGGFLRRILWGVGALAAFGFAFQIKESAVMGLPALLILALPTRLWPTAHDDAASPSRASRFSALLLISGLIVLALIIYTEPIFNALLAIGQPLSQRIGGETAYIRIALHTYLFSIGGSIWGTSPLLLLGLVGGVWLWRRGQMRLVGAVIMCILGYAIGHALRSGPHWFGGLSWPPRFLVPVIPWAMLLTLPVLEQALTRPAWMTRLAIALLVIYSAWIQLNAVYLPLNHYIDVLPPNRDSDPNNTVPFEWSDGLNRIEDLRWVLLPASWNALGFEGAWARAGIVGWMLVYGGFGLAAGAAVIWLSRIRRLTPPQMALIALLGVGLMGATYVSLRQLYTADPLYLANKPALNDVLHTLETQAQPGDVALLADNMYTLFFMNRHRSDAPRIITLPFIPGERANEKDPPQPIRPNPAAMLMGDKFYLTPNVLEHLAMTQTHVWLVAHNGPFTPWAIRPLERYLSLYHYLVQAIDTSDATVRLLEYSLIPAPDPFGFIGPEHPTDLIYEGHIHLKGYTLPQGTSYAPGDVVALSLYWQADTAIKDDAVIAWFIAPVDDSHAPLQGRDTSPYDGFAPLSTWTPNVALWDQHALRLPNDLPAGEYVIWVLWYRPHPDGPVRLPVEGADTREGTIGLLPTHLTIRAP